MAKISVLLMAIFAFGWMAVVFYALAKYQTVTMFEFNSHIAWAEFGMYVSFGVTALISLNKQVRGAK